MIIAFNNSQYSLFLLFSSFFAFSFFCVNGFTESSLWQAKRGDTMHDIAYRHNNVVPSTADSRTSQSQESVRPTLLHNYINREWPKGRDPDSGTSAPARRMSTGEQCPAAWRQFLYDVDNSGGWLRARNSLSTSTVTGSDMALPHCASTRSKLI